jgi:hypothetical protein
LVLGDFRAAQRVCLKLKLSQPANSSQQQQQQQISRQDLEELIRQQMQGDGSLQQQQQQGDVLDVWLVNTHLDHASPEIRARQMQVGVDMGSPGRAMWVCVGLSYGLIPQIGQKMQVGCRYGAMCRAIWGLARVYHHRARQMQVGCGDRPQLGCMGARGALVLVLG